MRVDVIDLRLREQARDRRASLGEDGVGQAEQRTERFGRQPVMR